MWQEKTYADTSAVPEEIDTLVYELFRLTGENIARVEEITR